MEIWGKSVLGRGNSKRKASEKEVSLVCLQKQREAVWLGHVGVVRKGKEGWILRGRQGQIVRALWAEEGNLDSSKESL